MNKILIIDDDITICQIYVRFLEKNGFFVDSVGRGISGIEKASNDNYNVILCDFKLPDIDGQDLLLKLKEASPQSSIIIITSYSNIKNAVSSIKMGAFDYLEKPIIPDDLLERIKSSMRLKESKRTTRVPEHTEYLKTDSIESNELYKQIELVSETNYSVIIYGESGTGKEQIARTIHNLSTRKDDVFISIDCGTLTRELAGSELFGHEKGSFTGSIHKKIGFFEASNKGTIFLDEVSNLPLDVQTTLLRALQEKKIKRVGGNQEIDIDVRIIVASNENLMTSIENGKFREDLYYRFNEFSINIPPLRNRKDDIMKFANFFLNISNRELNKRISGFDETVIDTFMKYNWPGNLRQMRNAIRRSALLAEETIIHQDNLPPEIYQCEKTKKNIDDVTLTLKDVSRQAEYDKIYNTLLAVKYNKTKAAKILKIDRKTLYNKMREYDLIMSD